MKHAHYSYCESYENIKANPHNPLGTVREQEPANCQGLLLPILTRRRGAALASDIGLHSTSNHIRKDKAMKTLSFSFMLMAAMAFMVLGCSDHSTPLAASTNQAVVASSSNQISLAKSETAGPSVNGMGSFTIGSTRRVIILHARTNSDGTVTGQGSLYRVSPTQTLRIEFHIDCLSVMGNVAIVTGILTNSTDPYYVGRHFQYKVIDNGEGANATPDQVTNMYNVANDDPYLNCGQDAGWDLFDIQEGNYEVRQQ